MHLDEGLRVEAVRRLAEMRQFSPEMAQKVALVLHKRMERWARMDARRIRDSRRWRNVEPAGQGSSKGILEEIEHEEPKLAIRDSQPDVHV